MTGFNPRAREGATKVWVEVRAVDFVSIHAPVKARHFLWVYRQKPTKFQSTRP